jgi:MFS family permease
VSASRFASSLAPLREREFRLLFVGQAVSLIGSAIAPIALAFAVLDLTGSASDLGFVLAAAWVPQVLFLLLGGVWADRLPRHLVMVGSNVLSGVAQSASAVLLLTGTAKIWHLVACQALRGVATSFFFPASQGLVPQTVPERLLQQANALRGMTRTGTMLFGSAAGGAVVALTNPGWGLAFDAATYFASAAVLALMRLPVTRVAAENVLHELRAGWHEFASHRWLWSIVVAAGFANMGWVAGTGVLGPVVAKRSLGGAAPWGAIVACEGAGLLLAGVVALRLRPRRPLFVGCIGFFGGGLLLVLLANLHVTAVLAAAALLAGFGTELFGVLWETALQQHIPLDKLSRVSSYDALGSFVLIPIGFTAVGPIASAIGVTQTLWLCAAVDVAATIFALSFRDVRELPARAAPVPAVVEPHVVTGDTIA